MGRYSKIFGLAGIGLLLTGLVIWVVKFEFDIFVAVTAIAGLFLLLFILFANFSSFRDFIGRRSTRYGAGSIVAIVLVLAIIVFVESISAKHSIRVDMTENKRYSLSDQTIKVLKGLNKDVEALAFFGKSQKLRNQWERTLKLYRYHSSHFKFRMVDPEMEPTLTKKHGVKLYGTTVVMSGGREVKIDQSTEEKLTNAILKVIRSEHKVVYVLKGHGEPSVSDESKAGYSLAAESLKDESYEVKELVLLREKEVPKDAALVMVSGPKVIPSQHELEVLSKYIKDGGSVLFMIDPGDAPGIEKFLLNYGVVLKNDVIVDYMSKMFGADFRMPVVAEYAKHPITENFGIATFFPVTRSLAVDKSKIPKWGKVKVIASTGPKSWGETNMEELKQGRAEFKKGEDIMGPLPVAVAVTIGEDRPADIQKSKKFPVAKIVVFGDSDFVSNDYISASGNRDLFLNSVRWLAGEEDLISIRPKKLNSTPLYLKASQARLIFILPVLVLPGIILAAGIIVITRRKRRR
jgi:ABC-type uncharacterized transport system involved in gliding motility auxiliary subunit